MLSELAVKEWVRLYQKETGEQVSFDEATLRANRMFKWLKTVTRSHGSKFEECKNEQKPGKNEKLP